MSDVTVEDLDRIIAEFDREMTTSVVRLTEPSKRSTLTAPAMPLRYEVYFRGVLMGRCTSMLNAERMKKVLLGRK